MRSSLPREIAALGESVRELARKRGGVLPGVQDWVSLEIVLLWREDIAARVAAGFGGPPVVAEGLREMRLAPAAEPLREALRSALESALRADAPAYRRAMGALRPVLEELLAARGAKWERAISDDHHYIDGLRCAREWHSYPEGECPAYIPSRSLREDVLVVAGLAVRCAAQDLCRWQAWYAGGEAQRQHEDCLTGGDEGRPYWPFHPAIEWARLRRQHELPPEEEAVLIAWGLATQEQVEAVKSLPEVPADPVADPKEESRR